MNLLQQVNIFRRYVMNRLTRNIGNSKSVEKYGKIKNEDVKRVLITRPNHRLGNQLLLTPLLQEVENTFPNSTIDIFVKGNLPTILFKNYSTIYSIIKLPKKHFNHLIDYVSSWVKIKNRNYDLVINASFNSSSGRLSTKFANSKFKFFGQEEVEKSIVKNDVGYHHLAKFPVYLFRNDLHNLGMEYNHDEVPNLNLKLSQLEIENGKLLLNKITNNSEKTIAIFTYATGAKCYSKEWWTEFYGKLKKSFPSYNIVEILPVENVSQINFEAPIFYSKDVREIGSVIANANIFIGADSGIMHLSSAVNTPTVGLFSVTNVEMYQPYGNNSIGIDTKTKSFNEIITEINKILELKN